MQPPEIVAAAAIPPTITNVFSPPTEIEEMPSAPPPTVPSPNPSTVPLPSSPPPAAAIDNIWGTEPFNNERSGVTETSQLALGDRPAEHDTLSSNLGPNREEPLPDVESASSSVEQPNESDTSGAPLAQPNLTPLIIPPPQQSVDTGVTNDVLPTASLSKVVGHLSLYVQPLLLILDRNRKPVPPQRLRM